MNRTIKHGYELDPEQRKVAGPDAEAVECFRLIALTGQRLRYLMDERLRADGLTTQQGFLLSVVGARRRPTFGEVAKAMSTTHQNVKQIAAALERKGMLSIVPDENDARARRLELTEASARYWHARDAGDFAAIGGWFAELDGDEQRELAGLLARLVRSLP
jgi:DNA-binding MarR family transcriptional regulator